MYNLLVKNSKIIHYAKLIDRITTSNLCQQLLNEIGVFFEKQILCDNKGKNEHKYEDEYKKALKQLPILNNLSKSLSNLEKRVNETKFDFNSREKTKREEFYKETKRTKFKEDLSARVNPIDIKQIAQREAISVEDLQSKKTKPEIDNKGGEDIGGN